MNYYISEENNNRIVFTEKRFWMRVIKVLFGLFGAATFMAGLFIITEREYGAAPPYAGILLSSFGMVFGGGALLIFQNRHQNPRHITFDNSQQYIYLTAYRGNQIAKIPYADLLGFFTRKQRNTSSSQSRNYHYVVFWQKKDSSIWDLKSFGTMEKAESFCHRLIEWLQRHPNNNNNNNNPLAAQLTFPARMERHHKQHYVSLAWRNPFSLSSLWMILLGFVGVVVAQYLQEGFNMLVLLMGLLVGLFALLMIYRFIKFATTTLSLRIDQQALRYLENDREKRSIPLGDIAAINFDFTRGTVGGGTLRILTHRQLSLSPGMKAQQMPNLNQIVEMVQESQRIFRIPIEGLNAIEKLQLEYYLQREIENFGGRRIL